MSKKLGNYSSIVSIEDEFDLHEILEKERNKNSKFRILGYLVLFFFLMICVIHMTSLNSVISDVKLLKNDVDKVRKDLQDLSHSIVSERQSEHGELGVKSVRKTGSRGETISRALLDCYMKNVMNMNDTAPTISPILVEAASLRVQELHLSRSSELLGHHTSKKIREPMRSDQWLTSKHFPYSNLFEYVVITSSPESELPKGTLDNSVRMEKFKHYQSYGAAFSSPYLVEIWTKNTDENSGNPPSSPSKGENEFY